MNRKTVALAGAGVIALSVMAFPAWASNPVNSPGFDVNSSNSNISGATAGVFSNKSIECDAADQTVVGGGLMLTNPTDGTPINASTFDLVYSAPQYSGVDATYKDSWSAGVQIDAGTNGRTYNVTVYVVCEK